MERFAAPRAPKIGTADCPLGTISYPLGSPCPLGKVSQEAGRGCTRLCSAKTDKAARRGGRGTGPRGETCTGVWLLLSVVVVVVVALVFVLGSSSVSVPVSVVEVTVVALMSPPLQF